MNWLKTNWSLGTNAESPPEQEGKYSREVDAILKKRPSWLIRQGTLLLLLFFIGLLVVSGFISYPDQQAFPVVVQQPSFRQDSIVFSRKIILTRDEAKSIREGQRITLSFSNPAEHISLTREGIIGRIVPADTGTSCLVYLDVPPDGIPEDVQGTAYITTGESTLLSRILDPVFSVISKVNRTE